MDEAVLPGRRRALAALMLVAAGGLAAAPAGAAIDLLTLPAFQSPHAAKANLLSVALAGSRLVVAGERGVIVYSDNSGASWTQAAVPVSVTLTTLTFVSPDVGWAGGHDGVILRTGDGGRTWHKQFDGNRGNALALASLAARVAQAGAGPAEALETLNNQLADARASAAFGPSQPLFGLWFRDPALGIAVGAFGQIFHTANGGKTWTSLSERIVNPDGVHFNSIAQLADASLVISGEAGKLRRSRDLGASWETLDTGYTGHLYGSLWLSASKVLLTFGFAGNVLRSADDGKTWQVLPQLTRKAIVGGLVLQDGRVLLVAADGAQLFSTDQGASFSLAAPAGGRPVAALLSAPIANSIVVVGAGGARVLAIAPAPPTAN